MKKNHLIKEFTVVLLFMLCISCNYLDVVPDNVATIESSFSDRHNAEKYLATCYSYLPEYGNPWLNPGLLSGDEVWLNEEVDDGNIAATLIAKGFQNTNNPHLSFWDGTGQHDRNLNFYNAIRDCNIFLEEIGKVMDITISEKKRWIAEVKFLKAYYHFSLLQHYGPTTIVKENLPIYVDTREVMVYRDPVDDVVEYIIELIDESIADLPHRVISETTEMGRITKSIAASIKARVLVTAASPLFNGNSDFSSLIDNRGIQLFNPEYEVIKWQRAVDAAHNAIKICDSARFKLFDEYKSRNVHSEAIMKELTLRSICTSKGSSEVIWGETNFTFTSYYQRMLQPLLIQATTSNPVSQFYSATMQMAELFYSDNGVPINEDISFDYDNRYNVRVALTEDNDYVRSGEQTAILHFNREPRFYASIAFDRGTYVLDPEYYTVRCRSGELATKREKGQFSITGYWPKKFISPLNAFTGNSYVIDYEFPFPIMRLADLYLLYAEALNETKAIPDEEVYYYIDKVRERAGLKGVVESWALYSNQPSKPLTKEGMREIIRQERMIELAFEGQRFWDLRRWKLAKEYMNRPIKGWNIAGQGLEFYNVKTIYIPRFEFKDYFWPIKESEIIKNSNLIQNLGW